MDIDKILIEFTDPRGGVIYIGLGGRSVPLLDGITGEPVWIDPTEAQSNKIAGHGRVVQICRSMRGQGLRSLN